MQKTKSISNDKSPAGNSSSGNSLTGNRPTGNPLRGNPLTDKAPNRKWIGVHFQCCQTYTRIYLNRQQTAYEGHCPKCLRKVRVMVGPDGTKDRFFRAW